LYVGHERAPPTALVLQVLGVIDPNLLGAYSSNLFGIVCVAFVKNPPCRGYKRQLIMAAQRLAAPTAPDCAACVMNKTLLLIIVDFLFLISSR